MASNVGEVYITLKVDPPTGDLFSGRQKAIERLTPLAEKHLIIAYALNAHRAGLPLLVALTDALAMMAGATEYALESLGADMLFDDEELPAESWRDRQPLL
jgi:hypothetical protein